MIRLTTKFFPHIYRPRGLIFKRLSNFSAEQAEETQAGEETTALQEKNEEDKSDFDEDIEGSSQPLTKEKKKSLKRKLRLKRKLALLGNEEDDEEPPDFESMAFPKEDQHGVYGNTLRIEQESDSEIGIFPIFKPEENASENLSESELLQISKSGVYEKTLPKIVQPYGTPTYKMMCYLAYFDKIYKNEDSRKWGFLFKYMRADMATQMKMFPHKLEEQSFDLPLSKSQQIRYLQDLVDRSEFFREKPFRAPYSKKFGESIQKEMKDFRNLALKELKGFMRMAREAKESKDTENIERVKKILGFIKANFSSVINEAFSYKVYNVMSLRDFRNLFLSEEFLPISQILFNRELFANNCSFINNAEISELFKMICRRSEFLKNLEFVKYHMKFLKPDEFFFLLRNQQELFQILEIIQKNPIKSYDYLSFLYHIVRIYNIDAEFIKNVSLSQFNQSLTYIYWGVSSSPQQKEIFRNHLRALLNHRLKISANEKLSKFFLDLFLNSRTFSEAHASFALVTVILSRITAGRRDLSDLFSIYIATCSQESFDFYIKNCLQSVLTGSSHKLLKKALSAFAKDSQKVSISKTQDKKVDFLESEFFKYSHKSTNIFISYDFEYENLHSRTSINPSKQNLFELYETNHSITETNINFSNNPTLQKHQIAVDFMIKKDYTPYVEVLKKDFSRVFQEKQIFSRRFKEIISLFDFERQEIIEEIGRRLKTGELREEDLKSNRKIMQLKADLIKPLKLPLQVQEKTSFDQRFDRYTLHANEELKKFAELRENWANNVVSDATLRKIRRKRIKGRRGYCFIRRGGTLRLAKLNESGELVPLPDKIPAHIQRKMGSKSIYKPKLGFPKAKLREERQKKVHFRQKTKQKAFGGANSAAFSTVKAPKGKDFQEPEVDEDYEFSEKHIENESGFKVYLQKLKQIEEERKKQEDTSISEKEIASMKKKMFQEDSLFTTPFNKERPLFTSMKSKGTLEEVSEKKPENLNKREGNLSRTPIFKRVFPKQPQEEEKKPAEENIYVSFWQDKLGLDGEILKDFKKAQGIILSNLGENKEKRDELLKALVLLPKEGPIIVSLLLSEKVKTLEKSEKLRLEFASHMGIISNDYNHYLKGTCFDYALPTEVYVKLLEMQMNNVQYNRKVLKRIMAHMIRYSPEISSEIIEAYLNVAKVQAMGLTTVEFLQLIMQNNIIIRESSAKILLTFVGKFKTISEDIEELYKNLLKTYDWPHNFEFLEGYLDMLIAQNKSEIYMKLFENIKEFLLIRRKGNNEEENPEQAQKTETDKATNENVEIKDNEELEQKKIDEANLNLEDNKEEKQHKSEVHSFYIDFVACLNRNKEFKFAKLVFYDFLNQKFSLVQRDYINGLIAFTDSGEEFLVLFNRYKETPFFVMNEELFKILVGAVNANPVELMSIFDEILENYIYTKKFQMSLNNLNNFIFTFARTRKFFEFTNFLRFVAKNKFEIDRNTKLVCYKVLSRVSDDMSKPYIKGLIDSIFDENPDDLEAKKRMKKNLEKAEMKKAKKLAALEKKEKSIETLSAKEEEKGDLLKSTSQTKETAGKQQEKVDESIKKTAKTEKPLEEDQKKKKKKSLSEQFEQFDKPEKGPRMKSRTLHLWKIVNGMVYIQSDE